MDNMTIYNATRSVPAEAQKAFNNGRFKGTDINPMWRIKALTEQFGPAGIGWYTDIISRRAEQYGNTVMAIYEINLYVKVDGEWSKPIYGTGGNILQKEYVKIVDDDEQTVLVPSDEGYKMAYTDALSVACKALGIGADVYFSQDKDKYVDYGAEQKKPAKKPDSFMPAFDPAVLAECEALKIDIPAYAVYIKKSVSELTDEDLANAISKKKAHNAVLKGGAA